MGGRAVSGDLIQQAADDQRARLDAALAGESDPLRRAALMGRVAAEDAAQGWRMMAEDMHAATVLAEGRRGARALRLAAMKAGAISRLASSLDADLRRLL